jgi:hypothetical protein
MTDIKPRLFTCRRCGATLGVKTPTKLTLSATVHTTEPTPITCNVCNMRTFWRPIIEAPAIEKPQTEDVVYNPPTAGG